MTDTMTIPSYWSGLSFLSDEAISAPTPKHETVRIMLTDPPTQAVDLSLSHCLMRITWRGKKPAWLDESVRTMQQLAQLPANWSSYGSHAIEDAAIISAARMMWQLLPPISPAPVVVPTLHGGVALAWHRNGMDIEIEFSPEGSVSYVYTCDRASGVTWEPDEMTAEAIQRLRATVIRLHHPQHP
jgi:hypothetical protein